MRVYAALTLVGVLSVGPVASAGPLDATLIPEDPSLVVHLDVEAFAASKIGKIAWDDADTGHFHWMRYDLAEQLRMDPLTEFLGVTIYCSDFRIEDEGKNCVLVLHTTSAIDDVVDYARDHPEESDLVREVVGGRTIWHWDDRPDDRGYACILERGEERLVVVSQKLERVIGGVDVIEGQAAHFVRGEGTLTLDPLKGAIFFAQLGRITGLDDFEPVSRLIKDAERVAFQVSERKGKLIVELAMIAGSVEDAANVRDVVTGMMALARLAREERPELDAVMPLISSLSIRQDGRAVRFQFEHDVDDLVKTLRSLEEGWSHGCDDDAVSNDRDTGGHDGDDRSSSRGGRRDWKAQ